MAEDARAHFCPQCMCGVVEDLDACARCRFKRPSKGWPADRFVGRLVDDKYRLERRLGAGGFALVFLARQVQGDIDLGQVVLKYLQRSLADNASVRRRFINEARAARRVGSPHMVKVFDLGFDEEGLPYMVMEYIQGQGLDELMKRKGPLDGARALRIALQVAGALEECHQAEIIHRDLKPDNLMLLPGRDADFVKVLDFGIARVPTEGGPVTKTIMGTPRYMAPEQILQQGIDVGVDVFALGVILFECLAGRSPITCDNSMEYLTRNLTVAPTPLRELRAEMPVTLERLLTRMMAKERADRPASMADVEQRLRIIGQQEGWLPAAGGRARTDTEDVDPSAETIPPPSEDNEGLWVEDLNLPDEDEEEDHEVEHPETVALEVEAEVDPLFRRGAQVAGLVLLLGGVGLWLWAPWEAPATAVSPIPSAPAKQALPPPAARPTPDAAAPDSAPPDAKVKVEPPATKKKPRPRRPRTRKDKWGKESGGL